MTSDLAIQLLLPPHIGYAIIDRQLKIVAFTTHLQRFAEVGIEVRIGDDVCLCFPELIGCEEHLTAVLASPQNTFELKTVYRNLEQYKPLYLDIYAREFQEKIVIFFEEVTDKMLLEQTLVQSSNETNLLINALSFSQDYINKVVDAIAEALLVTNSLGIIKTVNLAAENLFGYSSAELIGQSINLIVQDTQSSDRNLNLLDCFNSNNIGSESGKNIEINCLTKSGEQIIVAFACSKTISNNIDPENFIYIGRDITSIKHTENLLLESEERYRELFENATNLMFENANDLIQWIAPDGHFVYVNKAWQETLKYDEADTNSITIFDTIHPDCQLDFHELFESVISKADSGQIAAELITKNQEKIWVEGRICCKASANRPVALVAIFKDITARVKAETELQRQQKQTESLLLNILPAAIAEQLKNLTPDWQVNHPVIAKDFAEVTVLFADIVDFTEMTDSLSPIALVELLNQIFSTFDRLSERHSLEKIKTIGDAYMVVGGLPETRENHAELVAEMALDMQEAIANFNQTQPKAFSMRIGIHSGLVVAGVIGIKKFTYDLWGDTVNIASRMESQGISGKIQVSEVTYNLLKHKYHLQKRGTIPIKGKGDMTTYLLTGRYNVLAS